MTTDVLTPEAMFALGADFAKKLGKPCVIGLVGQLGAGKTHWVQGFVHGLGSAAQVTSPTFGLIHSYPDGKWTVHHFDFYRLDSANELLEIGWDDYLDDAQAVTIAEWADRFPEMMPADCWWLEIQHLATGGRRVISNREQA